MYSFLTGPMLWVAMLVFFGGLAIRVVLYIRGLSQQLDRVAYGPHFNRGIQGAVHSALKWLVPFGTYSWRAQPFFTVVFFLFHIGLVLVPLFLAGHNIILEERFGFSLPTLPMGVADALTVLAIIGGVLIALRRVALTEVRILTDAQDWFILGLSLALLVSGFIARLHLGDYETWITAHIIFGEAVLILAPFTKLSHIALYFMSRGQLGMDYAIKRGGATRGPAFPW